MPAIDNTQQNKERCLVTEVINECEITNEKLYSGDSVSDYLAQ